MTSIRAHLQLVRLPNIFTAMADVVAGYWLFSGPSLWSPSLAVILLSSACLYACGIVFNDLHDLGIDRSERPERPLPSGRISPRAALILGIALVLIGLCGPLLLVVLHQAPVRSLITALLLLAFILLYDFKAKSTPTGPFIMGACRALNLYLGMSAFWFPALQWPALAILAFFLYVASFSYFGRDEARLSEQSRLKLGAAGIAVSIGVIGFFSAPRMSEDMLSLVLWFALAIHLARIALRAIRNPQPREIMYAMKTFIFCIILFDAVIVSSGQSWPPVVIVLSLLLPAMFAGRFLYST